MTSLVLFSAMFFGQVDNWSAITSACAEFDIERAQAVQDRWAALEILSVAQDNKASVGQMLVDALIAEGPLNDMYNQAIYLLAQCETEDRDFMTWAWVGLVCEENALYYRDREMWDQAYNSLNNYHSCIDSMQYDAADIGSGANYANELLLAIEAALGG